MRPSLFFKKLRPFVSKASTSCVLVVSLIVIAFALHASAQNAGKILTNSTPDWTWSDNVGWTSLSGNENGVAYGVTLNADKTLTGYAWNDNIGWISFNQSDVGGCTYGQQARVQANGQVLGQVRALSGTGGWDGCINLGTNGQNDGLTLSNGALKGYAWGSDVVGWVSFNGNLSCVAATSCSQDGTQSIYTDNQCNQTTTQCQFGCNTTTQKCSCQVKDTCSDDGNSSIHTSAACTDTPTACAYGCDTNSGLCRQQALTASGCLSVGVPSPCTKTARIRSGSTATLYWNISNVTSCTITGSNGDSWSVGAQGSQTTRAITANASYNISCTSQHGTNFSGSSVTITLIPSVKEI